MNIGFIHHHQPGFFGYNLGLLLIKAAIRLT
jgi:hypothetical protein